MRRNTVDNSNGLYQEALSIIGQITLSDRSVIAALDKNWYTAALIYRNKKVSKKKLEELISKLRELNP